MSEAMNLQAQNLEQLNNLYLMQSLLTNMQTNIYLIEQGAAGQIIQVSNANLFQLAAQYYGDATLWTTIAEANGLTDPVVQPTITMTLTNTIFLTLGGFVTAGQSVEVDLTFILSGTPVKYVYITQELDTLQSVAANLAAKIPGALAIGNLITLPSYTSIAMSVSLFLNIVIPQSTVDQAGILEVV